LIPLDQTERLGCSCWEDGWMG